MTAFEIPARQAIKIELEEKGEWVVLEQDGERVAVHRKDLPEIIGYLCGIAGVDSPFPE